MSNRKRRFVLHNDNTETRLLAKRLLDKGYVVVLQCEESEEVKPYPF